MVVAVLYKRLPKLMIKHAVLDATKWLTSFSTKNTIPGGLSPANIVLGSPKIDCKTLKLLFGTYVQLHIGTTNTPVPAIALRQSNSKGGYYFMSLETGKELHGIVWTDLPMNDHIISLVEEIATRENQPLLSRGLLFEWAPGVPILDDYDDIDELEDIINDIYTDYNSDTDDDYDPDDDDSDCDSDSDDDEEDDANGNRGHNRHRGDVDNLVVTDDEGDTRHDNDNDRSDAEQDDEDIHDDHHHHAPFVVGHITDDDLPVSDNDTPDVH